MTPWGSERNLKPKIIVQQVAGPIKSRRGRVPDTFRSWRRVGAGENLLTRPAALGWMIGHDTLLMTGVHTRRRGPKPDGAGRKPTRLTPSAAHISWVARRDRLAGAVLQVSYPHVNWLFKGKKADSQNHRAVRLTKKNPLFEWGVGLQGCRCSPGAPRSGPA